MPPTSEAQRKAMEAAAHGRSTLGIPQSVGKEFVGDADAPHAAGIVFVAPDGDVLMLRRASTEKNYAGHWSLPGGKADDGETPEICADREAREEIGDVPEGPKKLLDRRGTPNGMVFSTYAKPVDSKFVPTLNDEHSGYAWASLDQLPKPLHPSVEDVLGKKLGVTEDMSPEDWAGLRSGFAKWTREEEQEPEHAEDDAGGKLTEQERAEADKGYQVREEMPESVFLESGARKYPVKEKHGDSWVYSRDLLLAAAREARMHGHEDLAKRADEIREREFSGAQDSVFAFDKSVRDIDADGRMHVASTNISKANICGYMGSEIPGWEELRLDPQKMYQLLRDPAELEKAAPTFNNIPLLSKHVPVTVDDHQPELVVGSTGTDAEFSAPFLKNSLVVWSADAIKGVETGRQKELSAAYRYTPDMTPGIYRGQPYDGVMRDIRGNHVALVEVGRAGSDVVVADSMPNHFIEEPTMAKITLSPKAAVAKGAILAYLGLKLAQDAKPIDLGLILKPVTSKNWGAEKKRIAQDIGIAAKGKLAKDASLDDLNLLLDKLDGDETEVAGDDDDEMMTEDDDGIEALLKGCEGRLKPEEIAKIREAVTKASGMTGDDDKIADKGDKGDDDAAQERKNMVTKPAMDAALKVAHDNAVNATMKRLEEIRVAERAVQPLIGQVSLGLDSAEAIYRAALKAHGVKAYDTIDASALPAMVDIVASNLKGAAKPAPRVAADSDRLSTFRKTIGDDRNIRQIA